MKSPAEQQKNTRPEGTPKLVNFITEEGLDEMMLLPVFNPSLNFDPIKAFSAMNGKTVSEYGFIEQPTGDKPTKTDDASDGQGANGRISNIPHVLCVDDDPDILSIASMSLETVGGFKVSCCSSGAEAIERIDEINPDIILLDVMMPMVSGPETLKRLKSTTTAERTPIVFMTARVQQKEIEEYIQIGAAAVLHKPFDPMQLSSQLKEILQHAQLN